MFTLAMVWVATICIGWALSQYSLVKERREILDNNELIARTLVNQGDVLLDRARMALQRQASNLSRIDGDITHQIQAVEDFGNSNGFFDYVFLVDTHYTSIAGYPISFDEEHKTSWEAHCEIALNSKENFSDAMRGPLGELVVMAMVPVYDSGGNKITGYLAGCIDLQTNDLLSSLFKEILLPDGGYGYVVDSKGRLLYHPENYRLHQDVSFVPFVSQVIKGKGGIGEGINIKGVRMLAAFQPMKSTGWGVVVQVPMAELNKRSAEERDLVFSILFIFSLVMVPLTLIHAEILIKPLRHLMGGVSRVAKGDFSTRIPVGSQDEIGWLTQQFNNMVERLEELYQRERDKEQELRQHEKLSVIGQMAAGLAHEIRNPLTPIKGYIQLLLNDSQTEEKARRYLGTMLEEVNGLERIVNEFLLLSKPGFPKKQIVSLVELLERVTLLIEGEAKTRDVQLLLLTEGNPWAYLDQEQIAQVVLNMAMNGLQAMPQGGRLTLFAQEEPEGETVLIQIQDSGVGIAKIDLVNLGQPFYTTKETGTGLGLTISYRIVHNHGGNIQVQSVKGEGTTFSVRLPKFPDNVSREVTEDA